MFILAAISVTAILAPAAIGTIYLRYRRHMEFKNSAAKLMASHETFSESLNALSQKENTAAPAEAEDGNVPPSLAR